MAQTPPQAQTQAAAAADFRGKLLRVMLTLSEQPPIWATFRLPKNAVTYAILKLSMTTDQSSTQGVIVEVVINIADAESLCRSADNVKTFVSGVRVPVLLANGTGNEKAQFEEIQNFLLEQGGGSGRRKNMGRAKPKGNTSGIKKVGKPLQRRPR
jgi:hypothetical protein